MVSLTCWLGEVASRSHAADRMLIFFFSSRRRHTRLQGDWSSDVCSSDLGLLHVQPISGSVSAVAPVDTPDPFPLPVAGVSVGLDRLRKRLRLELADPKTPDRKSVV